MDAEIADYLKTGVEVARTAGKEINGAFLEEKRIECKSSAVDLVTETDKHVEDLIISTLKKKYPTHSFIGEESTAAGKHCEWTDNPTWIIDPVDGTTNFVHSFPYVAVSIGLTINRQIVLGIVYIPVLDDLYTATKGGGAFLNGKKIQVSCQEDLKQSLLLSEVGSSRMESEVTIKMKNYQALVLAGVHGLRSIGSAAVSMCLVAKGCNDAYYEYGIHSWDMAAGAVIVLEAGGVLLDTTGGPFDLLSRRVLVASSRKLADSVSSHLTHLELPRD
ncbi:inositol monophosphatase 1-like [Amphiura filiformis]|uniref:inositol monophosphatase 1-like n=1 Tax=Amphiura filiformis TaxID=82378 RepID=UPI003B2241B8